jgi:hypothetical protein
MAANKIKKCSRTNRVGNIGIGEYDTLQMYDAKLSMIKLCSESDQITIAGVQILFSMLPYI